MRFTKRGSLLVIVLWLITALGVFGIALARLTWSGYHFAGWKANNFLVQNAVESVLLLCKFERMNDLTMQYDSLLELAHEEEYISGNIKVVYSLIDEEQKININKMSSTVLENLPSFDEDKAVAIVNSEIRPFSPKEEILLVEEIKEEDFEEIKDLVTIYGNGQVNINTCDEKTLEYLSLDNNLIDRIIDFRKGEDEELYTSDDGFFESTSVILDRLKEQSTLTLKEEQTLVSFISKQLIGVKSDNYEIKADIYNASKLIAKYSVIFGRDDKAGKSKYFVKEWHC